MHKNQEKKFHQFFCSLEGSHLGVKGGVNLGVLDKNSKIASVGPHQNPQSAQTHFQF